MIPKPKKIIVLGSGSLKIGEAGEFDYSGSQCLKALKEEGIKTVLINPNIATIQTSEAIADKVYFLPVTPYFVERVMEKERPDGIMLAFGGQTALNCGIALENKGILKKHAVRVYGTPVHVIESTEDRDKFDRKLKEIDVKTAESKAVSDVDTGLAFAEKLGYPVMTRVAFALGGKGSGVARNEKELKTRLSKAFSFAPQVLIEKYLGGWKEIEYEVVRDVHDNCITVCNMENIDPMGIHTGESIVIAPSQTLTDQEYHMLREVAIRTIRHLGVVGECNIQYALDPHSMDYRVIEVNARLSRSSALASKATGYPLAFVAAKLALGHALTEVDNSITKVTKACFEPALDYVVLKIPRWDLEKFKNVRFQLGSQMKSVGEVMAIGRSFEEVLQKALRMLGVGLHGVVENSLKLQYDIDEELQNPTDKRMLAVAMALQKGWSVEKIHKLSKITPWFLHKISNIVKTHKLLKKTSLKMISPDLLRRAKKEGFSDNQIARAVCKTKNFHKNMLAIRTLRKQYRIVPAIKQIDTLAAEYPAKTNYLYMTYHGTEDDVKVDSKKSAMVLGSGCYRIGSSVEFDWCCVNAVKTLKSQKYQTIMVNYNPETVSTDYDECDRLYFDEMTFERVMDIYDKEKPEGIVVSMGGQIPNNLAMKLHDSRAKILGTSPLSIDRAENRKTFSALCDSIDVDQPEWTQASSVKSALAFADKVQYPVLIRPSYVLSGAAMSVAFSDTDLKRYLQRATEVSKEFPVVISKFITGAKEIEIDAVARDGKMVIYAISEHVENAGVHSGDATMVLPPQFTYLETVRRVKAIAKKVAKELKITGPFNIQFIAKANDIKVIECNLRASRSFPFVSKVTKHNFIELATKAMLGIENNERYNTLDLDYVGVKAPQFSFSRLEGADPILSVEMASTGEVGCLGDDVNEAYLKSLLSVGYDYPKKNILVSSGPITSKADLLQTCKKLVLKGYNIFTTQGTHDFLEKNNVKTTCLHWPLDKAEPNVATYLQEGKIDLVINIPKSLEASELENDYIIRRTAVDYSIPLLTNVQNTKLFVNSICKLDLKDLEIKSWDEYN